MAVEYTFAPALMDRDGDLPYVVQPNQPPWFVQPVPIRDLSRILRVSVDRLVRLAEENNVFLPPNGHKMIPRPAVDRLVELACALDFQAIQSR